MYSTSDAGRAMVIVTLRAVFGRLVGILMMRSSRIGRPVILVNAPIPQLDQLAYLVDLRARVDAAKKFYEFGRYMENQNYQISPVVKAKFIAHAHDVAY